MMLQDDAGYRMSRLARATNASLAHLTRVILAHPSSAPPDRTWCLVGFGPGFHFRRINRRTAGAYPGPEFGVFLCVS